MTGYRWTYDKFNEEVDRIMEEMLGDTLSAMTYAIQSGLDTNVLIAMYLASMQRHMGKFETKSEKQES